MDKTTAQPADAFDALQAPLRQARKLRTVRATARYVVALAMVVLSIEAATATVWAARHPESVHELLNVLPMSGWLTLSLVPLLAIVAAWRYRRLLAIAERAQQRYPSLGLRLSASIESESMQGTSSAIRSAVWRDALGHVRRLAWCPFLARASTATWVTLAIVLLLLPFILFTSARPATADIARGPKVPPVPTTVPTSMPAKFMAALKIVDPDKDMWATKIEAVPLAIAGNSPLGIADLRLSVSVNGGPRRSIPLEQPAMSAGTQKAAADLYLDELELEDYDVVAYRVVGEAKRAEGKPVTVASAVQFVQVRPFKKDIDEVDGAGGKSSAETMAEVLMRLIDDQRRVAKGAWLLHANAELDGETAGYRKAAERTKALQAETIAFAQKAAALFRERGEAPESVLAQFDTAAEQMSGALNAMRAGGWEESVAPSEQALATLVDLLKYAREQVATGGGPSAGRPKPPPPSIKDRQTLRQKEQDAARELDRLAAEQESINEEQARPPQEDASTPSKGEGQAEQDRVRRQRELVDRADAVSIDENRGAAARDLTKDAAAAMRENAGRMASPRQPADEGKAKPGERSKSTPGEQAADRLRQAAAADAAERRDRQARELRQMLGEMSTMQADLRKPGGDADDQQKAAGAKLGEMAEALVDMAETPGARAASELADAAAKSAAARDALGAGQGNSETLSAPIAAVAKAYDSAIGRAAHLQSLANEAAEMTRQAEGLKNQTARAGKPDASPSPDANEWMRSLDERGGALREELNIALGQTVGTEDLARQMEKLAAGKAAGGSPSDASRDNGPTPNGEAGAGDPGKVGTEPTNGTEKPGPSPAAAGAKPGGGNDAEAGKPTGQPGENPGSGREPANADPAAATPGNGTGNGPSNEPGETPDPPAPGSRATSTDPSGTETAAMPSAEGMGKGPGRGKGDGPGVGEGSQNLEPSEKAAGNSRGVRPLAERDDDGGVVKELGAWRDTFEGLQSELAAKLQQISPTDALKAIGADETPAEYRQQVNAYYEKLSREMPGQAN